MTNGKINFHYSYKNIQIPDKTSYLIKLIEKIKSVTKKLRWKALFFLNDEKDKPDNRPETFGFKSRKIPPFCTEMGGFEKDFPNTILSTKLQTIKSSFQLKLKEDVNKIRKSKNVFVFATRMTPKKYQKLLQENVTKIYQKAYQAKSQQKVKI